MAVIRQFALQGNLTVADSGWIDASAFQAPYTIDFYGLTGADACDVRVSNSPTQPTAADVGRIYGGAVSADGLVTIAATVGWIKVRRTGNAGGGSVSAAIAAARPPYGTF